MGLFDRRKLTEEYMDEIRKQTDPYGYFCLNEQIKRGEPQEGADFPFCVLEDLKSIMYDGAMFDPGEKPYVFFKSENCLYETAELSDRIASCEGAALIYWDEDRFYESKRHVPFFKPEWSPDTLLSCNYIGDSFLVKTDIALTVIDEMSFC